MYLQIAVQTGVISLLLFLLMPLSIWIAGLRKEKNGAGADHKSADKISDRVIINGILLIYLIAGVTNDSMVVLAPIYFVMLGLGTKKSL